MTKKTNTNWFHFFSATLDQMLVAKLSATDIIIYLLIKQRADFASGIAWVSVAKMAEKARVSEKTVMRATKNLVKNKFLIKNNNGKANAYRLVEQIPTRNNNVAIFTYSPISAIYAQDEIKKFAKTGEISKKNQVQFIKNQININNLNVQVNIGDVEIKDQKLRLKMERLLEKALKQSYPQDTDVT